MNVKVARDTLNLLKTADRESPEVRIASRWLVASMAAHYDALLRIQMLEGAAGVPVDTWMTVGSRNPLLGLARAKAYFDDPGEKNQIQPQWFASKATSTYSTLSRVLAQGIRSYKLSIESDDILNSSLMGMPMDTTSDDRILRQPYQAGKQVANKIKNGEESPETVAKGPLAFMLNRKIQNIAKKRLEQFNEDDEGRTQDITDADMPETWGAVEETAASDYLSGVMFGDLNDPLGKEIRRFMRDVWGDPTTARSKTMTFWLDQLEAHKSTDQAVIADKFDLPPSTFYSRHWIPAWRDFFSQLWNNHALMTKINQRLRDKHLEPLGQSLPQEALDKILPPRKRASSNKNSAVAQLLNSYFGE